MRGGAGRQQRSTGGRQMSRQNHSTNITTTFLTQHKTKTATTIEISRQHLKINDNKTRERKGKSLQTPITKVCDRHGKSLRTPTTKVCERHCQSLTRCYGSRKVSHVFASTLLLLPKGVIFKLSTKILTAILLIYHDTGASRLSLPRCRFHIVAQEPSDKILTRSQSRSIHRKRTYIYIISRLLEVKGDSVKIFNFYMSMAKRTNMSGPPRKHFTWYKMLETMSSSQ